MYTIVYKDVTVNTCTCTDVFTVSTDQVGYTTLKLNGTPLVLVNHSLMLVIYVSGCHTALVADENLIDTHFNCLVWLNTVCFRHENIGIM